MASRRFEEEDAAAAAAASTTSASSARRLRRARDLKTEGSTIFGGTPGRLARWTDRMPYLAGKTLFCDDKRAFF